MVKDAVDLHWGGKSWRYFLKKSCLYLMPQQRKPRSQQKLNKVVVFFNFVENHVVCQNFFLSRKVKLTERKIFVPPLFRCEPRFQLAKGCITFPRSYLAVQPWQLLVDLNIKIWGERLYWALLIYWRMNITIL